MTEAIHLIQHLMERYSGCCEDLYMVLLDPEDAYDIIPRGVIWGSLEDREVLWMHLKKLYKKCTGELGHSQNSLGDAQYFLVKIGLHQNCHWNVMFYGGEFLTVKKGTLGSWKRPQ